MSFMVSMSSSRRASKFHIRCFVGFTSFPLFFLAFGFACKRMFLSLSLVSDYAEFVSSEPH
jgi:hypothetical protein